MRAEKLTLKQCSIKEGLRRSFANSANEFALCLNTVSLQISELDGDPEVCMVASMSGWANEFFFAAPTTHSANAESKPDTTGAGIGQD